MSMLTYGFMTTGRARNALLTLSEAVCQLQFESRSSILSPCACFWWHCGVFEVSKLTLKVGAVCALVLCAGSYAFALEEQRAPAPVPGQTQAEPQAGVQSAAPASKADTGTEIRIPGLGKLGTLPKMDFGLELLYGAAEGKSPQDPVVDDNQDLTIRGSVKHKF